jgi:hypothetical protein
VRTCYRNGDEIRLSCGCNDCSPARINGVLCHEQGCPSAWKDYARTCVACGTSFYSPRQDQKTCHRHQ